MDEREWLPTSGDFERLVAVLDPDVVLRVDFGPAAESREVRGARKVAGHALFYSRRGLVTQPERLREFDLTILDN
jgi:hypothetical protein